MADHENTPAEAIPAAALDETELETVAGGNTLLMPAIIGIVLPPTCVDVPPTAES